MGKIPTLCWNYNGVFSFRCILLRHFFYSSTTTTTTAGGPISSSEEPNSVSSLTNWFVSSLGFSPKQALETSTKLTRRRQSRVKNVCTPNLLRNADSVVKFLHQKGLQKPQIGNVVYSAPQILSCRIDRNLEPKMEFFLDLGLSASEFARVISTQNGLLSNRLDSTIRPAVEQLRTIMGSNENVVRVIKGIRWSILHLVPKYLVSNVSTLRAHGIPIESIRKRILQNPSSFMRNPEDFEEIIARVETKWGISPRSSTFLCAVQVLCGVNEETIESKCRVFEGFGWDRSNVEDLFRCNPNIFRLSEGNVRDKLDFLTNEMGCHDPGYIIACSTILACSLEKRVVPRYRVFQVLKEKGLVRRDRSFYSVVLISESRFLTSFVWPFVGDVPDLHRIYVDSMSCSSSQRQTCVIAG